MKTSFESLFAAASDLPIVDWHNHLDIRVLSEDAPLGSLYEVWVKADPYKHRAMRICGEPERLITGDAPEAEKWAAWKRTLPRLVGNPLFDWAREELDLLGIDGEENVSLAKWRPSDILRKVNAEVLSPCVAGSGVSRMTARPGADAPGAKPRIVPSMRLNAGDAVPEETLERFHAAGCRVVDISVDDASSLALPGEAQNSPHLAHDGRLSACQRGPGGAEPPDGQRGRGGPDGQRGRGGPEPPDNSTLSVCQFAAAHGWTMLLHIGALRETSSRLRAVAGPAGGYAAMRAPVDPAVVARFLNTLEREGALPRTILLTLNPEAHAQLAVLSGSFTKEGSPGHVQLGPAWWWCDHAHGVRDVLEKTAAYGVLSTFIGMTTDSRSILSLARHRWFRRTFCKWVAGKVATGDFPDDPALLRPLLENICYRNARRMFAI